jgi:hypothetical protein
MVWHECHPWGRTFFLRPHLPFLEGDSAFSITAGIFRIYLLPYFPDPLNGASTGRIFQQLELKAQVPVEALCFSPAIETKVQVKRPFFVVQS